MDRNNIESSRTRASGPLRLFVYVMLALNLIFLVLTSDSLAGPKPAKGDARRYPIDTLILEYERELAGMPAVADLMNVQVSLSESSDGYVAGRDDGDSVNVRLRDLDTLGDPRLAPSAIRAINQAIVDELNRRGYVDVYIAPAGGQFTNEGEDIRPEKGELRINMRFGEVIDVRTRAAGERFDQEGLDTENNPAHSRIVNNSPIGPRSGEGAPSVIRKDLLDDYLFRLNRHPGRRVDATLSSSKSGRGVSLDYVVTENKEWIGYAQFANNGTEQTDEWRQRFGFVNNQLTNRDDIFSFDYITAGFSDVHAGVASYEAPFFDVFNARWRANANYSQFTSSDVAIFGTDFEGEEWGIGADIFYNFYQDRNLFVDAFGGFSWRDISAQNVGIGGDGNDSFFLPRIGVRVERFSDTVNTAGALELQANLSTIAGTSTDESDLLGRPDPDIDWQVLKWNFTHSFFLEPLLNKEAWEDASTPDSSTLAHEIALGLRGQYAFDYRIIPHAQQTVGGVYTVRGYAESIVAGDSAFVVNAEYRLHIPRLLEPRPVQKKVLGKPFRFARESVYGRPDWDFVAKGFVDIGTTSLNDKLETEDSQTLIGAGFGFEALFRRNVSIRADFGFALEDVDTRVSSGDSEIHIVTTFLF